MEKPQAQDRQSYLGTFYAVDKTPEGILLRSVLATAAVLIGAALFAHDPTLLVPAAILIVVLHVYHVRRVRAVTGWAAKSAMAETSPSN